MKRDWDLVRTILNRIEAVEDTETSLRPSEINGYPAEIVSYHFHILNEAGLINATCSRPMSGPLFCLADSLTWDGHEFLDKIRNDTVWNKIKSQAKDKSIDLSFDAIKALASIIIGQVLG